MSFYWYFEKNMFKINNSFTEEIAARIGSELKRMQRRKQLFLPTGYHSPPLSTCSALGRQSPPLTLDTLTCVNSSNDFPSTSQSASGSCSPKQKDVPLFTFKQVAMICERMVREHEEKIREDYDKVLNSKLSGTNIY